MTMMLAVAAAVRPGDRSGRVRAGIVRRIASQPMTDDRPRPTPTRRTDAPERETPEARRRGSCSCATGSPRRPVRCSRVACPASISRRRASSRPRRPPTGSRRCRSRAVYASPIERTTQTAQCIAARHGLDVRRARRRDRSRLRRMDRRQDRRPREDRRVEGRAGRAVARAVPRRRVDPRDAGAHGRRARRRSSPRTRTRPSSS